MPSKTEFEDQLDKVAFCLVQNMLILFGHCSLWEETFKMYAYSLVKLASLASFDTSAVVDLDTLSMSMVGATEWSWKTCFPGSVSLGVT